MNLSTNFAFLLHLFLYKRVRVQILNHIRFLCLRFCRIKHKGLDFPGEILSGTYKDDIKDMSGEGLSLVVSRYLLKLMNGDIHYVRKVGTSTFILTAELASSPAAIGQ